MVKAVFFLKRKPGMGLDEFGSYWRTRHAELVRKLPGLRRYVQCHTIRSGYIKGEPVYDGVAELWYDDLEAIRRLEGTPEATAAAADGAAFLDTSKGGSILTEERVKKDGAVNAQMMHLVEFVTRKPGMDVASFSRHWSETHGPLVVKIPQIRRYVQSPTRPGGYADRRQPLYDGVAEVWFDSTDAMRESAKTPEYRAVREDEPNFINVSRAVPFIITQDFVVL
jgi:uncharacterized protein (TIGR02118 family)